MYSRHNKGLREGEAPQAARVAKNRPTRASDVVEAGRESDSQPKARAVRTVSTALVIVGLLALSCGAFALGKNVWGVILIVLSMVVLVLTLDDGGDSVAEPWE